MIVSEHKSRTRFSVLAGLLMALGAATAAGAQTALTTLDSPQGGRIVYGPVDGATTEAAAMGAVLRSIHSDCGEKPQVGKVFAVRGTASDGVFFTVVNRSHGNVPVAGLIIAARSGANRVDAALVTDSAARFGSTVNPMLKQLFAVWHPAGSTTAVPAAATAHNAAPLHRFVTQDGSASVALPAGWTMLPASRYGTIIATGPNGELATLGFAVLAMDANNPRVRQTEAFAEGAGRNTSYAHVLYYPYGNDLASTFVAAIQHARQNAGAAPAAFAIAHASPVAAPAPSRCANLSGTVDIRDGKGRRAFLAVFCSGGVSPMGQFMNLADIVSIPGPNASRETGTAAAILASFTVNENVVSAQAGQMAAPEIARIQAIGQRAAQQAASAHAMEDQQNASVERQWDAEDRNSEAFGNYLLDQTVIQDNENNTHTTAWNSTADALVRADPSRYQYVDTANYWKGVDY